MLELHTLGMKSATKCDVIGKIHECILFLAKMTLIFSRTTSSIVKLKDDE